MKKITTFFTAAALLLAAPLTRAQAPKKASAPANTQAPIAAAAPAPAGYQAPRIAVVDAGKIFQESIEGKETAQALQTRIGAEEQKLQSEQVALKALYDDLQKKKDSLSPEALASIANGASSALSAILYRNLAKTLSSRLRESNEAIRSLE